MAAPTTIANMHGVLAITRPLRGSRISGLAGRADRSPAGSEALRRLHRPTLRVRSRGAAAGGCADERARNSDLSRKLPPP
jgi:hypothetical protein